jgi:hypothetical protein
MDLLDNLGDKAKDAMNDPAKKRQIEQLAKEKGISIEQAAKEHLSKQKGDQS